MYDVIISLKFISQNGFKLHKIYSTKNHVWLYTQNWH